MKITSILKALAIFAVVAVLAVGIMTLTGSGFHHEESQTVDKSHVSIMRYQPELTTCLGPLITRVQVSLTVKSGVHFSVLGHSPGVDWHDGRDVDTPASLRFCLHGTGGIITSTTRTNPDDRPGLDDTILIHVARDQLFVQDPHLDFTPVDETYRVKDGMIVERNGDELVVPEPIYAQDGQYTLPHSVTPGSDTALTDLTEGVTLGALDIGSDATANSFIIAQNEASNPNCIAAAWEDVSPQVLAHDAFVQAFVEQGYDPLNVHVGFTSAWPQPEDITDQNGLTYTQRHDQIVQALPGGQEYESGSCTSNVANTSH